MEEVILLVPRVFFHLFVCLWELSELNHFSIRLRKSRWAHVNVKLHFLTFFDVPEKKVESFKKKAWIPMEKINASPPIPWNGSSMQWHCNHPSLPIPWNVSRNTIHPETVALVPPLSYQRLNGCIASGCSASGISGTYTNHIFDSQVLYENQFFR